MYVQMYDVLGDGEREAAKIYNKQRWIGQVVILVHGNVKQVYFLMMSTKYPALSTLFALIQIECKLCSSSSSNQFFPFISTNNHTYKERNEMTFSSERDRHSKTQPDMHTTHMAIIICTHMTTFKVLSTFFGSKHACMPVLSIYSNY